VPTSPGHARLSRDQTKAKTCMGAIEMGILNFDEQMLVRDLDRLPPPLRVVFAAASAERLLPTYMSFSRRTGRGDAKTLTAILERLWLDMQGNRMDSRQVQENIDISLRLIPEEDSGSWVPEQALAEDAAAAVAYAVSCRQSGRSQEAAWAARRAYEALDHFVINQEGIDPSEAGAEERVLSHPPVQAELLRQRRDIDELLAAQWDVARVAQQIRQRSQAESRTVFQPKAK
jgi:uncharacterized protein YjaG (DUF416 family)